MDKTADQVGVGESFEDLVFRVLPEFNQQYLGAVEDFHPRYREETEDGPPMVHPSLLINFSNIPRSPSFRLAPGTAAVLTHEETTFVNPATVGKTLRISWKVVEVYEKRGRRFQVKHVRVVDESGVEILRRRMVDTYFGCGS